MRSGRTAARELVIKEGAVVGFAPIHRAHCAKSNWVDSDTPYWITGSLCSLLLLQPGHSNDAVAYTTWPVPWHARIYGQSKRRDSPEALPLWQCHRHSDHKQSQTRSKSSSQCQAINGCTNNLGRKGTTHDEVWDSTFKDHSSNASENCPKRLIKKRDWTKSLSYKKRQLNTHCPKIQAYKKRSQCMFKLHKNVKIRLGTKSSAWHLPVV